MQKIEGYPSLRKTVNGAIVSVDNAALKRAKKAARMRIEKDNKINTLEERIARLEKLINGS